MAYHGDIYYDAAVNNTTTPSPPLAMRRLDPTRLCLKTTIFSFPDSKRPSEKVFKPDRCEGGLPQLKKNG